MRYIYLVLLMVVLVGCVEPDPMRAAIANERTIQATNSQAAQAAQIERAQQADADARNAQALLQALQAQQAIVAAQAAQAQAASQAAIVESNNQALVLVADRFVEASRPDYTPLYVTLTLVTVLIIVYMLIAAFRPKQEAQAPKLIAPLPKLLPSPPGTELWLYPNGELQQIWIEPFDSRILAPGDPMYRKLLTDMGGR